MVCLLASFTSVKQLVYYCDSDEFLEVKMLDISKDVSIGSNDKLVGIKAESFILKICHWQSWEGKLIWGKKRIPVLIEFVVLG